MENGIVPKLFLMFTTVYPLCINNRSQETGDREIVSFKLRDLNLNTLSG